MPTADELYDEAVRLKDAGDLVGAVARLQAGVALNPDHIFSHSALGVYLHRLGQPDEAIRHALRVTELAPKDPFSYTQLSVIYQRCGRIPEAEAAMAQAHQLQAGH